MTAYLYLGRNETYYMLALPPWAAAYGCESCEGMQYTALGSIILFFYFLFFLGSTILGEQDIHELPSKTR